jgi:hypothetical protein
MRFAMVNRHRAEVELPIGADRFRLRLTLQALAEMESALGASDLQALGARFSKGRVSARDLTSLIGAAIRGGGATLSDAELAQLLTAEDLPVAMAALGDLFNRSFGREPKARPRKP